MQWMTPDEAVAGLAPGCRVLLPHGCVETRGIYRALAESAGHPDQPVALYSGLQFGEYPFLGDGTGELGGLGPGYRYVTWQVGPAIRKTARGGRIGILPLRYRDIPRVFGPGGELEPDVLVIQCAPPRNGSVNLGFYSGVFPTILRGRGRVIAEVHPDMPRFPGDTEVPLDRIDVAVEAEGALGTLARAEPDDVDRAIVDRVLDLIPDHPWIQLGVGAIPDAILGALHRLKGVQFHSGMLSDPLMDFLDRTERGVVLTGELAGSVEMYRRAAADPRVVVRTTEVTHHLPVLAALDRFVSINSAIEIDIMGQVNGETVRGHQLSGVGGSLDYVEAARYSAGGMSIMAMRSKAGKGSRIVPTIQGGNVISVPRFTADWIVTEHGAARLYGLDLDQRAEALIGIAAPEHRDELQSAWDERRG